jgi:hypothetical protein
MVKRGLLSLVDFVGKREKIFYNGKKMEKKEEEEEKSVVKMGKAYIFNYRKRDECCL